VDLAGDGREALGAFKRKPYDLIFMDIQMPVMDGYQAARAIREIEAALPETKDRGADQAAPGIPIIAMTAHALDTDKALCLEAGMDDFIAKPLTGKGLLAMAARWVNRRSGRLPPAEPAIKSPPPSGQDKAPVEAPPVKPIDLERALAEFEGDREFLFEVFEGFKTMVAAQIGILRRSLSGGDAETVRKVAHSIKGGAANLTAEDLSQIALALEGRGKAGELKDAGRMVDALEREFLTVRHYFQENFQKQV
jgi:two-component system sensor histidine kinase/response regulator